MLVENKKVQIVKIIQDFSRDEILWSIGYLSSAISSFEQKENKHKPVPLTIIYVSETGNSKFAALKIAEILKQKNFKISLTAVEQYDYQKISREKNLLLITSTHGDGEIPAAGQEFFNYLSGQEIVLSGLNYGVIGLGDSNYPLFCQASKKFSDVFKSKAAIKIMNDIEFDLDFENHLPRVAENILALFSGFNVEEETPKNIAKKSEYSGKVSQNINLNDEGSTSQTHHIEILAKEEIDYEAGDAIGILLDGVELGRPQEEKIRPRLYSVTSSKSDDGFVVSILVKVLRYSDQSGNSVEGLFSSYLAKLKAGDEIKFYVVKNRNFKIPAHDKDIIMIGVGTGIAPYRGFLADRKNQNAQGKNWLFFGERNFASDFYYQTEWQNHLESNLLTRMDVAFSRDQKEKIYVQDEILRHKKEFSSWLESGAYIYICGDKNNMAKDVEASILKVIAEEIDEENPQQYLQNLEKNGRYLKDVY